MTQPTVQWRDDGTPVSPRFGDIYRSLSGLTQAREVFLRGCGLLPGEPARVARTANAGDVPPLPAARQAPESTAPGVLITTAPAEAPPADPAPPSPSAWAHAASWAVLETGFGLGLNFLATWQAWREDSARPQRLFYSAVEAWPPDAADLLRSAAPYSALRPLAKALAEQWHGLLPGLHRIRLDEGRVQLTLAVGDVRAMLAELSGRFDSIYLDGFDPARNPDMWGLPVLKAVARLARPGARAATWSVAASVREGLTTCGLVVERVPGPPPKRSVLRATLAPHWSPKRRPTPDAPVQAAAPGHCVVVGAGLAGASVAYSLAQRGWQVTVLDQADEPATGASGLPAGVVAPHVSPDDRPVSRLTRAGARATLARAAALLQDGVDFAATGVLERHAPGERRLPADWLAALANAAPTPPAQATAPESWPDTDPRTQQRAQAAGVPLDDEHRALWHAHAGWIRPAALVRAMLGAPGISWVGRAKVTGLRAGGPRWQVLGERASAPEAVAPAQALPPPLPLHALRGQVAWGPMPPAGDLGGSGHTSAAGLVDATALPPFPVNGHGSLIAHVPADTCAPLWVTGSTFERGQAQTVLRDEDHAHNRTRLGELLPNAAKVLDTQWADGRARPWAGVRATLPDRLPAVGAWATGIALETESNPPPAQQPPAPAAITSAANQGLLPVHVLTGLGARGLTLAVLCGEIAAAWLHDEPLPVEATLARKLRAGRFGGSD
ncbi:FAD-dependent 5-carboxymethylaminomethyl-2-thiouridine(34) oxidoreductase MnmC [Ottowia oryzae]|uniref:tRNA 5-methylaminomethyl-2-thiouridine biosynthesis bifunctional protein MnmC n=1 Tax=Ottowia oryzae TaxID=2109914 RepID=A0A2S0MFW0_9BURK|nr:FAD-dependent 5-carboxymethylaminomethyl-2-thiouridine(34) oxidoreductase MnmC [Ottowia oryzae]AVO34750.1 FAD-dependent cmnm(5)s(2)U34 oxidoreductase [Ottowia oryzae]